MCPTAVDRILVSCRLSLQASGCSIIRAVKISKTHNSSISPATALTLLFSKRRDAFRKTLAVPAVARSVNQQSVLPNWYGRSHRRAAGGTRTQAIMRNVKNQKGKIGYIILWLMGVPFSVLLMIFLLRGCT